MHLVERDEPRRALVDAMASARARTGRCAIVTGEAGIGKTSLLRDLAASLDAADCWWGECVALETPHPLAPLYDVARQGGSAIRTLLASDDRAALFDGVVAEIQRRERPLLFVVEDLHWADDATVDLLAFVGRRIARLPCVLALTYRDDEIPFGHPVQRLAGDLAVAGVTRIELSHLSPAAVDELARRAFRSPAGLFETTHGNPFLLSEMLRHNGDDVPRSVRDLVLARMARLPPDARRLLQLAAIVPARIEHALLARLLAPSSTTIDACLNAGLLVGDGDTYAFRHELARMAVESSLSPALARELHGRVLRALSATKGTAAARLVHHALHAGDGAAIRRYAADAALLAQRNEAHREAAAHFRTLVAYSAGEPDAQRAAWLEGLANESRLADDLGQEERARRALAELYARTGERAAAAKNLAGLAMVHVVALRNGEADATADEAVALCAGLPPSAEVAEAHRARAHLRMLDRDCVTAIDDCRAAERIALEAGATKLLGSVRGTLGTALLFVDYDAGRAMLEGALNEAHAVKDYATVGTVLANLGSGSGEVCRFREAERYLAEAVAFAERHELEYVQNYAAAWRAMCALYRGRWDDAERDANAVLDGRGSAGIARLVALTALGRLRSRRGDPGALPVLDQALELAEASRTLQRVAPVRAARAEAAMLRGDRAGTIREAQAIFELAVARRHPWFAGELAYWLHRAGALERVPADCAEPYALEIGGDMRAAAAAWDALGAPYERDRALERAAAPEAGPAHGLTARELEVLTLLCDGLKNAEIAARLMRSVRTVDHHVAAAIAKLGASNRAEAVATALRTGLVSAQAPAQTQSKAI